MRPLLQEIFDALLARGWQSDGNGHWRHPRVPGESFSLESAIHAQSMIEISDVATEIKREFGFDE
jgi:hypothetical protein